MLCISFMSPYWQSADRSVWDLAHSLGCQTPGHLFSSVLHGHQGPTGRRNVGSSSAQLSILNAILTRNFIFSTAMFVFCMFWNEMKQFLDRSWRELGHWIYGMHLSVAKDKLWIVLLWNVLSVLRSPTTRFCALLFHLGELQEMEMRGGNSDPCRPACFCLAFWPSLPLSLSLSLTCSLPLFPSLDDFLFFFSPSFLLAPPWQLEAFEW